MSHLKSAISSAVKDLGISVDSCNLVELLTYPLNVNEVSTVDESTVKRFYDSHLVEIIKNIYSTYFEKEDLVLLNIIRQSCLTCKPDTWFLCLIQLLRDVGDSQSLKNVQFIIQQLEYFIFKHQRLSSLLSVVCDSSNSVLFSKIIEELARNISSLPNIAANRIRGRFHTPLLDNTVYVKAVVSSFEITNMHKSPYAQLCGAIVGQLAVSGSSDLLSDFIINDLQTSAISESDSIWSAILLHISEKCLEPFLQPILFKASNYKLIQTILVGVFCNQDVRTFDRYLRLYRRILFVRYFSNGIIVRNIFSPLPDLLLATKSETASILANSINSELGVPALRLWADTTAIMSTSLEQRVYTSQVLASWITDFYLPITNAASSSHLKLNTMINTLLPDVLSGISNHLQSTRQSIRILGMAVGEWLVEKLGISVPLSPEQQPIALKFDYEETDAVTQVRPFFNPLKPINLEDPWNTITLEANIPTCGNVTQTTAFPALQNEFDSDDDPEAFDSLPRLPSLQYRSKGSRPMADVVKIHRPRYLRECLDGLMLAKPEDNEVNLACTAAAADLIYAHPNAAKELALDFARVLLHIEPPVSPNDSKVESDRHSALVALGVVAPKQCARYLTSEFGQPSLSIGQRSRILHALTDICCQLSSVGAGSEADAYSSREPTGFRQTSPLPKKIGKNTRYYFSSRTVPKPARKNAFIDVCGDFFFPMLCCIPQLFASSGPFAHQDTSLLANLVAYLATVYASARFAPVQDRMASELVTLLPTLYRHNDCAVRRAVLIAVGTLVTMTPSILFSTNHHFLSWNATNSITSNTLSISSTATGLPSSSLAQWLKWCVTTDADSECQLLAQVGLSALTERLSELIQM